MDKTDFKKEYKEFYKPSPKEVVFVELPVFNFIIIDGQGDPNTSREFQDAIETLFPVSYSLKFMSKKELERDYVVMPLEGLWWADDMDEFSVEHKDDWKWSLMIMQPEFITEEMYRTAVETTIQKKNPPSIDKLRFEKYDEGLAAQIMHIGPFSEEGPNIRKVHDFIKNNDCELSGKHHEIYLSDFRKVDRNKMKTILRQPCRKIN